MMEENVRLGSVRNTHRFIVRFSTFTLLMDEITYVITLYEVQFKVV